MNSYPGPRKIVAESLRLLKEREDLKKLRSDELRIEIAPGIQQADLREFVDGPETFRQIRSRRIKRPTS
jgi:hypothetical protein